MKNQWPKNPPALTEQQIAAREGWMRYWHEILGDSFGFVERFNHGFPAKMHKSHAPLEKIKTLEVGAGLGEHPNFERLDNQEYHLLEYRKEWAEHLQKRHPTLKVVHGDIQKRIDFPDHYFDRIIAVHVLEHLRNLPEALNEIDRLLKHDGHLDLVLPCEGGLAYEVARNLTSARMFKKKFKMSYKPIIQDEHVNDLDEILYLLQKNWEIEVMEHFPLKIPVWQLNVIVGLRLKKIKH